MAAAQSAHPSGKPALSWPRLLVLLPFIIVVNVMNGRVDARRARWLHLGYSTLLFLLFVWDAKFRWFAVGYVAAAGLNFFSLWLIETVGTVKKPKAKTT